MTEQPPSPPVRVALLLSGLARQWRECLPSQLALFEGHHVDVFFHFWDTIDAQEKEALLAFLKPRAYSFEAPQDFSAADSNPLFKRDRINIPSRMLSQYYSWRGVGQVFAPFKAEYDLAMRSRTDLQFVYGISHIFPQLKPIDLVMQWWEKDYLLSDLFALGGVEPIAHFHTLYDHVRSYAETKLFNSETLLATHLEQRPDFHIYAETFRYFFVRRPHMANYTIEEAMQEKPGRSKWLDPEIVGAHKDYFLRQDGEAGIAHVERFQRIELDKLAEETGRIAHPIKT